VRYVVDIDGTICTSTDGDYTEALPITERINMVNDLYDQGHTIFYQTARGMGRHNNDFPKAYEEFYEFTVKQLSSWGVKCHGIFLGKAAGDYYIDDKSLSITEFFCEES
tara:strand:- start:1644 stop:1970 length:327 start_codon:yes stop_codon:yes gene_type:complete